MIECSISKLMQDSQATIKDWLIFWPHKKNWKSSRKEFGLATKSSQFALEDCSRDFSVHLVGNAYTLQATSLIIKAYMNYY